MEDISKQIKKRCDELYQQLLESPKSIQRAVETPSDLFIYLTGQYDACQEFKTKFDIASCPLCGKPNEDGKEHKECMDREAMLVDKSKPSQGSPETTF